MLELNDKADFQFIVKVLTAFGMGAAWIALIVFVNDSIPGVTGGFLAFLGSTSLMLAIVLAYNVAADWRNMRFLRRFMSGPRTLIDGEFAAIEGQVKTEGDVLISPFGKCKGAAYQYRISRYVRKTDSTENDGTERAVIAFGCHMVPTTIVGEGYSLALRSMPGVESDMRYDYMGSEQSAAANELMSGLDFENKEKTWRSSIEINWLRQENLRKAEVLKTRLMLMNIGEISVDVVTGDLAGKNETLSIQEECIPSDETVCAIGTYDEESHGLTGARERMGDNLIIYRGGLSDVLTRMSRDISGHLKAVVVMVAISLVIILSAFYPEIFYPFLFDG